MTDTTDRDEVKLLIATGVVASVVAYILLKDSPTLHGFPFNFTGPDPLGIGQSLRYTFLSLLFWFSGCIGVLALVYSFDVWKPTTEKGASKLEYWESAFRRFADVLFLVGVVNLIIAYLWAVVRVLETL